MGDPLMIAGITILVDYTLQNYARKIAYILDEKYGITPNAALYPAHISLKQPFACESLPRLEAYCDELAARIAPFPIELDEFYASEWNGNGILGLSVVETPILRNLHNRLNHDLSQLCADTSAPFDGDAYRFHLTIEMGIIGGENPYRAYYENLVDKKVNLRFTARHFGLFYSSGEDESPYILYKIIPLSGQS